MTVKRHTIGLSACLLVMVLLQGLAGPAAVQATASGTPDAAPFFVQNLGQFPSQVRFQAQFAGGTLWLADDALWLAQTDPAAGRAVALRLTFPEGGRLRFRPLHRAPGRLNYYVGDPISWRADVPLWQAVRIEGVAPGLALELDGRSTGLAWRVVGSAQTLALRVEGAESLAAQDGGLRIVTALGALHLPLPVVADEIDEVHEDGVLRLRAAAQGGAVAATAASGALFGTYLGGSNADSARDVALGSDGSVYVTGQTMSVDFPRTAGPATLNGSADVFVARLAAGGGSLIYGTYLGGSYSDATYFDNECGNSIAVDGSGNAYVTGYTLADDFPTTAGAYDRTYNGPVAGTRRYEDAFVAQLGPSGALLYGSYLGGSGRYFSGTRRFEDIGWGIAVHNGRIYVAGYTSSDDFPTTAGAYDRTYAGAQGSLPDAFLSVLNPAGGGAGDLVYSTYFGNSNSVKAYDLDVDAAGTAYLTGHVYNSYGDFPLTPGAYDTTRDDEVSAFVARINPVGGGAGDLLYSSYLDGNGYDVGYGLAVDGAGMVYVTGATRSANFPTTAGAFDATCGNDGNCGTYGDFDAFVVQLRPHGQGSADLRYGTYLGGNLAEGAHYDLTADFGAIALAPGGDVLVTGVTSSGDFPVTADAQGSFRRGIEDVFVARLRLQGQGASDLVYSTYLGGSFTEGGHGIAAADAQSVCVAGITQSADFPTTPGAYDTSLGGTSDAFVTCVAVPPRPNLSTSTKQVAPAQAVVGETVTFTLRIANSGPLAANALVTDTLPAALLWSGVPGASAGGPPAVNGQTLTWAGTVDAGAVVTLTYRTVLTSTTVDAPVAVNLALIGDGWGNVYVRRAFVNGREVFLPLALRN